MTTKIKKSPVQNSVKSGARFAAIMAAAMTLPAVTIAHADLAPERGLISLKYLDYLDSQPGQDRIKVTAPSLMVMVPIAGEWALSSTYTADSVSGASPAYHTQKLTNMQDLRRAIDLKLTRYLPRGTVTVGTSYSNESDYVSRGVSASATVSSEDKNTTFNFGMGVSNDEINPNNHRVVDEKKQVFDYIVGVTQILSTKDIAQINLGYSKGFGYFSDPYKAFDERPRTRDHTTALLSWNHHFDHTDGTSRLSYRYYADTYGIEAHTLSAEYVQPLPRGWTVTPIARYYTQTSADFYLDADGSGLPTFPGFSTKYYSEDQRLSAYGAISLGFKLTKVIDDDWTADFKYENYEQKAGLAINSSGSPNLDPFRFRSFQIGLSRKF